MVQHRRHVMETILDLSLEILCLLTGEIFTAVKSGDLFAIMAPRHRFVIPEITNQEKILQLSNRIAELLLGEIGNYNTEVKEEVKEENEKAAEIVELGCSKVQKQLYKAAMMEEEPAGKRRLSWSVEEEAPPRPRPHGIETQSDHASLRIVLVAAYGWVVARCTQFVYLPTDGRRVLPERSPRASLEEEHRTTPYHQGENLNINIKVEAEAQLVMGDRGSTDEECMVGNILEKDLSSDIHTAKEHNVNKKMEGSLTCKVIFHTTPPVTLGIPQAPRSLDTPDLCNGKPSFAEASDLVKSDAGSSHEKRFKCIVCGEYCRSEAIFQKHWRVHAEERLFPCSECDKRFARKEHLHQHLRCHSDERPYACSECDKTFKNSYRLKTHTKFHTGVDLHSCSVCGKQFAERFRLNNHERTHSKKEPLGK